MVNIKLLKRVIESKFGDSKPSGRDIRVNCPFCIFRGRRTPDTEYKLYITPEIDVAHCFRCDYASKASKLIPQVASYGTAIEKVKERDDEKEKDLEQLPRTVPLDSLPPGHLAIDYIVKNRNCTVAMLLDKGATYCEDYRKNDYSFGPRIVFPFFQFGTYRGFQARTIWKNTEPKYIGASNMKKKTLLYNYDEAFSQDEQLIIAEGPFDVLQIGNQSVGALGKAISDEQLRLIRMGQFKKIVMLLDPDAKDEGLKSAEKLAVDFNTYVGYLKDKDPGEMTKVEIDEFLHSQLERVY
jgi:5S rRNA maturation endonuclease (ribonuclease M5)